MSNTKDHTKNSFGTKVLHGNLLYTLISIAVGFAVGAILLQAAGISAGEAYGKLITGVFGKPKFIVWAIVYASPIILTGLSVAFSFQTGVFNIGAEGQYVVGTLAACIVGVFLKLPPIIHVPDRGSTCRRPVVHDRGGTEGKTGHQRSAVLHHVQLDRLLSVQLCRKYSGSP